MRAAAVVIESKGRIRWEIAIVLGLGLGQSAVYAVVALANRLTRDQHLSQQTATLNPTLSDREVFDLIYQLLDIGFSLVPVLLVCFLLWMPARPHLSRLGLAGARPAGDGIRGLVLAVIIGAGGIGIYLGARALDLGVTVNPAGLDVRWWTIPVLLLSALRAGLQEEVVVIGYLFARLRDLGWGTWQIIVGSALLRGTYHLYQGFGGFVGNVIMGLIFGWLYSRWGRVLPFVIAHFVIDAAIFVGYPWAAAAFPALFGGPAG
ncbi:MAG TPA: CPBP family intramembrane glutamic endopeptidase [Pseudolysinimonas sp.]|nr:CPBP family intramembrane glutamic endopeptidase [Pseudolysinimonas sp.]